ncbi:HGxxPAAW family protein [Nocardiopsis potens]|uniref:HGxxPAAW family protein n=1 Tax=Nocardiopsis potens TaxID=1246458 RepID=UPI0003491637|nr:HGxxPAAW family protein [Nocardiopsis potens]
MADAHHEEHEDHGNTVAAWFLTISWIVAWSVAAVGIMIGGDMATWTGIALGASVVLAVIAGVMKKAGLGRKEPRPVPPTREEWEASRASSTEAGAEKKGEPAPAGAK